MVGKEDEGGEGSGTSDGSRAVNNSNSLISGNRKMYWRSASWSSSHVPLPPLVPENVKDGVDGSGGGGLNRRRPGPLTPRSNSKGRSCLPPLSIARRSLDEWPRAGSDDVGEWPIPSTPNGRDLNNGERLKLDLSSIQRVPDKNGGFVKRDKIAFFDKECSKVAEHIFLGGNAVARDKDILKQHKITHILNCVGFVCPEYFKGNFVYRTLWLQDSPSEDITSILYDVFDYFEDVRDQGGKVFVHCCQGVSRSTSLVIAYRMWREGQSFDDAFQYVKAAREIADPNMGFACQLLQCQKRVHAFPLSPSSLLRLYRIAPHSSYDPLHLVPKMLNVPSPAALDSRGAFIMHVPSTIFIWVGKKCESLVEKDARGAVCQIVRYEKVQGPIVVVKEGEEPPYFWDAFSSLLPLMDKSGNVMDIAKLSKVTPGERLVDSYNLDFEVIQKAIVGGFMPPFASSETNQETHLPARESSWSVLRRKFALGNMKEFVLASKSSPSRVYPDTVLLGADYRSNSNSPLKPTGFSSTSSLFSSSSLSPSFSSSSSPDSISSDSSISSKCYSDSPAASPSLSSYSFSSTLSTLSNLSLVPTKLSPHSISKNSEFIDVNFTSNSCSQPVLSPAKKSSLSIAERRGGTPKCLKLPMLPDDSQGCVATEFNEDIVIQTNQGSLLQGSCSSCLNTSDVGDVFDSNRTSKALQGNRALKRKESHNLSVGSGSSHHNLKQQVVVLEWPSLEKVMEFCSGDMDSSRMFIFVTSSSGSQKDGESVLYLWLGKAFRQDCMNIPKTNKGHAQSPAFSIKELSNNVLSEIGLSNDTQVKVVKQDEEPSEFVALLRSL
uniref:protein-tyrosine-phosphatase MKP1-like n=1 Tax=Erigeron canadensis TaxID=72917 RepID=UPI001CB9ACAD|nr:protein-tyrosine-phosphatase MKP1-like [Erigeron canadensis]